MTFEDALRDELATIIGLSNKVFPLSAKQGTKAPYIIYISSEGIQDKSLDGYLSSKEVEVEINIVHDSYKKMKLLTKDVLEKILSFQGRVIGTDGPLIKNITYEKPVELYEKEVNLYRCVLDVKVRI